MLAKLFEEQVARNPEQFAVKMTSSQQTYDELNRKANRIARQMLNACSAQQETREIEVVALLFEHGSDMIAGTLGAVKAQKIYVPLDPAYPEERLTYIMQDAGVCLLVTNDHNLLLAKRLLTRIQQDEHSTKLAQIWNESGLLNIDRREPEISEQNLHLPCPDESIAYLLYTSGSTGFPKGVMQTHRNVNYYIQAYRENLQLTPADRLTLFSAFSHDAAVVDIFAGLLSGATLYPKSIKQIQFAELATWLQSEKITIYHSVPTVYRYFLQSLQGDEKFPDLRYIVLGGEGVMEYDVTTFQKRFQEHTVLINLYGQSESSYNSTQYFYHSTPFTKVTLGESHPGITLLVINEDGEEVEPLEVGEIVVLSDHVALGYWNDPLKTHNAFGEIPELGRFYRTGDLGRLLLDGRIEFMGRKDFQVKIRGYRVELGEIESTLLADPRVKETVVIAKADESGETILYGFFIPKAEVTSELLRDYLTQRLPEYMVPAHLIQLTQIPVTPNNKIDRKALQEMEIVNQVNICKLSPTTETEIRLTMILEEILHKSPIGVTDDYLFLGLHSLKGVTLVSRIYQEFQVKPTLQDIFRTTSIQALAAWIENLEQENDLTLEAILPADDYPVSRAQKRLLFIQQLEGDTTHYNMSKFFWVEGELDLKRLESAFQHLIHRHESLRTSFFYRNGEPRQRIREHVEFKMEEYSTHAEGVSEVVNQFIRSFDLTQAPLLRVAVVKCEYHLLLCVDIHHIISDGTSMAILAQELFHFYNGEDLPALKIQYKDYSHWQNQRIFTEKFAREEMYWLEVFADEIPLLDFPTDEQRPQVLKNDGAELEFNVDVTLKDALQQLAHQHGVTLYMVLLSVYSLLLAKYCGQDDLVIGTPIAGRNHADLNRTLGMFVNMLAVRSKPAQNTPFSEYLTKVGDLALKAFENQDYPYEMLVEKLAIQRHLNRNPLFDVVFGLQNMDTIPLTLPGLNIKPYVYRNPVVKFDLALNVSEQPEGLTCKLEYRTQLFRQETMVRFTQHYLNLLKAVVKEPDAVMAQLKILTPEEEVELLFRWNQTETEYVKKTVYQLFEEQVEKTGDSPALIFAEQVLNYRELNLHANRLACVLRKAGICSGQVVGLMVQPSFTMVIGLLAIWKAGGAYLPIDPTLPEERIRFLLADSKTEVLLTDSYTGVQGLTEALQNVSPGLLACQHTFQVFDLNYITDNPKHLESFPHDEPENLPAISGLADLAYIIYTSGSTGQPKGVMIEHGGISNTLQWRRKTYGFSSADRVLQLFSFSFDGFLISCLAPLLAGSSVVMLDTDGMKDPLILSSAIHRYRITHFITVPSLYRSILDCLTAEEAESLTHVGLGGEKVTPKLVQLSKDTFPQIRLNNEYGPTEYSVVTMYQNDLQAKEQICIGRPIANTRVYVLDEYQQLVPYDVPGELCIAGAGLARGYLNQPELTALKMIANPHIPGERFYRTGDRVRQRSDGRIEFLGRIDEQVKVRGYRIETGEIEAVLLTHPGVQAAVVQHWEEEGMTYLAAYYVTSTPAITTSTVLTSAIDPLISSNHHVASGQQHTLTPTLLRSFIEKRLPGYMIPAFIVALDQLPLTPNGKVDRKSLPRPAIQELARNYVAPANSMEAQLATLWADVLGVELVGVEDNFFEIGGHSLKASDLVSRIYKEMQRKVPLRQIFLTPTIRGLAANMQNSSQDHYTPLAKAPEMAFYPVTSAQKRMYLLHQMAPESTHYNLPGFYSLKGEIDRERLQHAFQKLVERHEAFRTSFVMVDGEVRQQILEQVHFSLQWTTCTGGETARVLQQFVRPFALDQAPLLRVEIFACPEETLLACDLHHIISDGVSMEVFLRELRTLYQGEELPERKIQYKDYAFWQERFIASNGLEVSAQYWHNQFRGEIPVLAMPTDLVRPAVRNFAGAQVEWVIDSVQSEQLQILAQKQNVTMHMLLLAIYNLLLAKYTGQEDIVIGVPVAGRSHGDVQNLIGIFVNTLALRNYPRNTLTFNQFVSTVREQSVEAYEHQDYPFEMLLDQLAIERNLNRNPLFDTVFTLQTFLTANEPLSDLQVEPIPYNTNVARFDLTLFVREVEQRLHFQLQYSRQLFKPETITRLRNHFNHLLLEIVKNPDTLLGNIEILSKEEKEMLLYTWNAMTTAYPKDKTLSELFQESVHRYPEQSALRYQGQELTYRELAERVNRLAFHLRKQGIGRNQIVGMLVERSPEMLIGIFAILQAGAAYLPIDPSYPETRIRFMLSDSEADLLLTHQAYREKVQFDKDILDLDALCREFAIENQETWSQKLEVGSKVATTADDLAYIIYTSGTTGTPKGTMTTHANISRVVKETNYIEILPSDRLLQLSNYAFDGSTFDIFGALCNGATLVLVDRETLLAPEQIAALIAREAITVFFVTTALFNTLVEQQVSSLRGVRKILFGGERASVKHVEKALQILGPDRLVHVYGPTESTVFATYYAVNKLEEGATSIPIGMPLANTQVHIFSKTGQLQPVGIFGELWLSGAGLARGYLNRPELTSDRFVEHPLRPGVRMYRTGDLARWLPEGVLEFAGRLDHQVKVRGFRIELGEVETVLSAHPAIREVSVILRGQSEEFSDLVAYYVADHALEVTVIRNYLAEQLPTYMIPAYFVWMCELPLTSNGKLNQSALPEPTEWIHTGQKYLKPADEIEEKLATIWSDILGIEPISMLDNFFELGGHSLKATTLVNRVHQIFQVNLPLRNVFQTPTIRELALLIKESDRQKYAAIKPLPVQAYYPVSSAQKRIYALQQLFGDDTSYNISGMFFLSGQLDLMQLTNAFRHLIERHEGLRTSFRVFDGELVQEIHPTVDFTLARGIATKGELPSQIHQFIQPFDLSKAPLIRVKILVVDEQYFLMYDLHHIISDGVSMEILTSELFQLYQGETLQPLPLQYKDYAHWQLEFLQSPALKKEEAYWLQQFQGEVPVLELPTDFPRPARLRTVGDHYVFDFDPELSHAVRELSVKQGTTLFMTLLAAYNLLLARYSGQDELVVGTPVAGRVRPELTQVIGMFVNTLALHIFLQGEQPFTEFLAEVKGIAMGAYEHQSYPFEMLVEQLHLKRDLSRNPLFDTMFALQNQSDVQLSPNLQIQPYQFVNPISKFDLTLSIGEEEDRLHCSFEYSTDLFKVATIQRLATHFEEIVRAVTSHPETTLGAVQMLTSDEREMLIYIWNKTTSEYPRDLTVLERIRTQAIQTPEATALLHQHVQMTYRELESYSNGLAQNLQDHGVGKGSIVALLTHRSCDMVIAMLAIMKAGGCYLPIDPRSPQNRITYMLDSGAQLLLIEPQLKAGLEDLEFKGEIIDLQVMEDSASFPILAVSSDLAYIIYTSGSTGNPKGVMVTQRNLSAYIHAFLQLIPLTASDSTLQQASYAFDVSIEEIFSILTVGGKLVIPHEDDLLDIDRLSVLVEKAEVTVLSCSPLILNELNQRKPLKTVHTFINGGDVLNAEYIQRLLSYATVYNFYGPTEATVSATYYRCEAGLEQSYPPIGKPLNNYRVYILDRWGNPVPIGVSGELCITGEGVTLGYLNRPELTAEKFVPDLFQPDETMYRTGDLVRWSENGQIEFIGRIDQQVKIRGFRIELGEIEVCLRKLPGIHEAYVLDRTDEAGNKYLVAYILTEQEIEESRIRDALSKDLPAYSIPTYFITLDHFPVNTNGKIDRNALPDPIIDWKRETDYVAPRNEKEKSLAAVWADVLGVERIGIQDNFFALGGDSIKAIQILARAGQMNLHFTVKDIFQYSTIEQILQHVDCNQEKLIISQAEVEGEVLLTPIQQWFFAEEFQKPHFWNQAILLTLHQDIDLHQLQLAFTRLIEHHDTLRMSYRQDRERIIQYNRKYSEVSLHLAEYDLTSESSENQRLRLQEICFELQNSLDLEQDLLIQTAVFDLGEKGRRLWISIHHLIFDGVSWRILLEDLQNLYHGGVDANLSPKTTSYKDWSERLHNYVHTKKLDIEYWEKLDSAAIQPLFVRPEKTGKLSDYAMVGFELSEEKTEQLLTQANRAYHTGIEDLLLAGLTLAVLKSLNSPGLLLTLEGHGREELIPDVDLTRTIGWFTVAYPVYLEACETLDKTIIHVKESLRKIPLKGFFYGSGRYLQKIPALQRLNPEVAFNYLGQIDNILNPKERPLVTEAPENAGIMIHPENRHSTLLDITGIITKNRLQISIRYHWEIAKEATKLESTYHAALHTLLDHCCAKETSTCTASDFDLADEFVNEEDFALLQNLYDLE